MITTQKEKVFAGELKELMKKHGVRIDKNKIENTETYDDNDNRTIENSEVKTDYNIVGHDININIEDFELWRNVA